MTDSVSAAPKTVYRERQWVPTYWWVLAGLVVALISAQFALNRDFIWLIIPAVIFSIVAVWAMVSLSKTVISVEVDADGTRWLLAEKAMLPDDVVARSLAVPATAKRNAMGRQLDPAAFVVSHGWVHEMVMLVLNDSDDPTPYWLIGTKNPEALLRAFVPDQAEAAIANLKN